jgi:site-specific recombinase XerD
MPKFISTAYPGIVYYQSQKSKDRTYFAKIKHGGGDAKVKWVKIGRASEGITPLKASILRGEKLLELRHGKTAIQKLKVLTVQQAVDEYLAFRKLTLAEQMLRDETNHLKKFIDFFSPERSIGEITAKDAENAALALRTAKTAANKGLSPQTILHRFKCYTRLFNHLIKNGLYTGANPFDSEARKLLPKINNEVVRYFNAEQNEKFINAVKIEADNKTGAFLQNIFGLYYSSGLRRTEAFNLEERDVDFERRLIRLRNPKSGKDKYIKLGGLALYFIERQIKAKARFGVQSPIIFCTGNGNRRKEIKTQWNSFKRAAGLPAGFRLHDLRHNFATLLASSGSDLYVIQKLLTHSSPKTTARYAHLIKERLINAADKALEQAAAQVAREED